MGTRTIYLTGGSGYLGGEILRSLALRPETAGASVVVPIRKKKGQSGPARFAALFGEEESAPTPRRERTAAEWADPSDPIPADTEVVVLNAFDVSFHNDVARVLRDSVKPMLELLEQCRKLAAADRPRLRRVVIVSTAFVQPPLPFLRCDAPIEPFGAAADPWAMYESILAGKTSWDDLRADPTNNPHSTQNAYIYVGVHTRMFVLCVAGKGTGVGGWLPGWLSIRLVVGADADV
eukprot:SAG31_NODE_5486_length_2512_cov_1.878989_4_plen_235_part_00